MHATAEEATFVKSVYETHFVHGFAYLYDITTFSCLLSLQNYV